MKHTIIVLFLLGLQIGNPIFGKNYSDRAKKIARKMRDIGSICSKLSSKEMKEKRLEFLNGSKDATIQDLIDAIEVEIEGQNIIDYLRSFNCDVCNEYALSVETDYGRGSRAINNNWGDTSIETVMYWRLL